MDLADGGYQTENGAYLNRNLTSTEQTATAFQIGGDGITGIGIVSGQPSIIGTGKVISSIGLGIEIVNDFATSGNILQTGLNSAIKIGISAGFGRLSDVGVAGARAVAGKTGTSSTSEAIILSCPVKSI